MSARRTARPAVKVGVHVRFGGVKWQVVAMSGQDIHLIRPEGGGQVVLAGHLFADPGFTLIGADVPQAAPQWGLFESAPAAARENALAWQRHVGEVDCGRAGLRRTQPGSAHKTQPQLTHPGLPAEAAHPASHRTSNTPGQPPPRTPTSPPPSVRTAEEEASRLRCA